MRKELGDNDLLRGFKLDTCPIVLFADESKYIVDPASTVRGLGYGIGIPLLDDGRLGEGELGVGLVDELEATLVEGVADEGDGVGAGEDVDLEGKAIGVAVLGGFGDDALDGDEAGVEKRGEDGGDRALNVADLGHAGVDDLNGVGIMGVERLADETDHLAAADGAGVVAEADDVGDDEAGETGGGGGGEMLGVGDSA